MRDLVECATKIYKHSPKVGCTKILLKFYTKSVMRGKSVIRSLSLFGL